MNRAYARCLIKKKAVFVFIAILIFLASIEIATRILMCELGKQYNVPIVDCISAFDNISPLSRRNLFFDIVHLTPEGNRLVAKTIADYIKGDIKESD